MHPCVSHPPQTSRQASQPEYQIHATYPPPPPPQTKDLKLRRLCNRAQVSAGRRLSSSDYPCACYSVTPTTRYADLFICATKITGVFQSRVARLKRSEHSRTIIRLCFTRMPLSLSSSIGFANRFTFYSRAKPKSVAVPAFPN